MRFSSEFVTFALLIRWCGVAASPGVCGLNLAASTPESEWRILFDGSSLSAWHALNRPPDARVAWIIEGDALAWRKGCGYLASREDFSDFEMELQWRISPAGNSGVIFRVDDTFDKPGQSVPEIQILDNARHSDARHAIRSSGAIYGLYAPTTVYRPVGEWNRLNVRVEITRLRVQVNGTQFFELDMKSDDWAPRVPRVYRPGWEIPAA